MKITRILAYRVELPLHQTWSERRKEDHASYGEIWMAKHLESGVPIGPGLKLRRLAQVEFGKLKMNA